MFGEDDARWLNSKAMSDMDPSNLRAIGQELMAAHKRRPGGLTIEVGTRKGGSAMLFAELLRLKYREPPPLWTVDPYGSKPYVDGVSTPLPLYHDAVEYLEMKRNLASYEFHTHWKMESGTFFRSLRDMTFWTVGSKDIVITGGGKSMRMPIGEERSVEGAATFILLDGEHSANSIIFQDLEPCINWLAPGGTVVIDNIDADPETVPMLKHRVPEYFAMDAAGEDFSRTFAVLRKKTG